MERTSEGSTFLSRIFAIARNTFREAVRDRILYNLVIFVLLITAAAIFLGELTAGQEARTIVNLGLNAMLLFGAFIAIFVGVGLVSKEIEKRTIYAIFSKPVTRGEFIIGKYLGLCLTLLANVIVMGGGRFAGPYVCSWRFACVDYLGSHSADIFRVNDHHGRRHFVLVVLDSGTFGSVVFPRVRHRAFQRIASRSGGGPRLAGRCDSFSTRSIT